MVKRLGKTKSKTKKSLTCILVVLILVLTSVSSANALKITDECLDKNEDEQINDVENENKKIQSLTLNKEKNNFNIQHTKDLLHQLLKTFLNAFPFLYKITFFVNLLEFLNSSGPSDDVTPPSKVTGLTVTPYNQMLNLSWDPSTDDVVVDYYKIYRNDSTNLLYQTQDIFYSDLDVINNVQYTYCVSAVDTSGNEGEKSDIILGELSEEDDTENPSQVTGLSVIDAFNGKLQVSWDAAVDNVGIDFYRIYRDNNLIIEINSLEYLDTGLVNNKIYTYRITAVDFSGNEGEKSNPVSEKPTENAVDNNPPSKVTGLNVENAFDGKLIISWDEATDDVDVDHYKIYRDGTFLTEEDGLEYLDSGLTNDQKYNYQISAVDKSDNEGEKSTTKSGIPTQSSNDNATIVPESGHILIVGSGYIQLNTTLNINGTLVTLNGLVYLNSTISYLHIWWNLTTGFLKINTSSESTDEEDDFKLIDFSLEIKDSDGTLAFYFNFISMYGESCIELNNNAQTGSLSFDGNLKIGSINGIININNWQGVTIKGSFYGDGYQKITGNACIEWDLTGEKPMFLVVGNLTGNSDRFFSVDDLVFEIENSLYVTAKKISFSSNGYLNIGEEITIDASIGYLELKNLYVSVDTNSFSLSGNFDLETSAKITIKTDPTLSKLELKLCADATMIATDFGLNLNNNLIVSCNSFVLSGYGTLLIGDEIILDASITSFDVSNLYVMFNSKTFILSGKFNLNAAAKVYVKTDFGLNNLKIGLFASGTLRISNLYAYVQSLQLTVTCKSISIFGLGSLSFGSEIAFSAYLNSVNVNSLYLKLGSKALTLSGIITLTGAAALYIRTNLALTKLEFYLAGNANLIIDNLDVDVNSGTITTSASKITLSGSGAIIFLGGKLIISANITQASIHVLSFYADGVKIQINGMFDLDAAGELHIKTDISSYVELVLNNGIFTLSGLEISVNSGSIYLSSNIITVTAGGSGYVKWDKEKLEVAGSGTLSLTIDNLVFDIDLTNYDIYLSIPTLSATLGASAQEFKYYFSDENDNGGGGDDGGGGGDSDPITIKGDITLSGTVGLTINVAGAILEGESVSIDLSAKGNGSITANNLYYDGTPLISLGHVTLSWTCLNIDLSAGGTGLSEILKLLLPLNIDPVKTIGLELNINNLILNGFSFNMADKGILITTDSITASGDISIEITRGDEINLDPNYNNIKVNSGSEGLNAEITNANINNWIFDLKLTLFKGDIDLYRWKSQTSDDTTLTWSSQNGFTLLDLYFDPHFSGYEGIIDFSISGSIGSVGSGNVKISYDLDDDGQVSIDTISQDINIDFIEIITYFNNWGLKTGFDGVTFNADGFVVQWDPPFPSNLYIMGSITVSFGRFTISTSNDNGNSWTQIYDSSNSQQDSVADAGGQYIGYADEPIQLDASNSQPEGQLEYRWDYTNNGIYDTDWLPSPYATHEYPEGTHTVRLKVRNKDDILNTDTDTATVIITEAEGYIQGYVRDITGNPLSNAHVITDHGYYSIYTDDEGYYALTVNPDTYILQATKTNYKPEISDSITVKNSETKTVDFCMDESSNLYGYVKDTSGNNIGGAKVQLDNGQYAYTYSVGNMMGQYSFNWELSPGTYDITASKSGYYDTTMYNYVVSQGANRLDFTLQKITPIVKTLEATSIDSTSACLNGDLESMGGTPTCTVWFVYDTSYHSNWQDYAHSTSTITKTSTGSFYESLSGLQSSTTYHFRAVALNTQGYDYGSDKDFITTSTSPGWVRPSGYQSTTGWQNENNARDTSTSTYSHYYKVGDTGTSDYDLILTYDSLISCNQIKIDAKNMDQLNYMSIKLYEGSNLKETCFFTSWQDHSYTYDSFTTTQIDKVKITFTLKSGFGYGVYQPKVYDFQVYQT